MKLLAWNLSSHDFCSEWITFHLFSIPISSWSASSGAGVYLSCFSAIHVHWLKCRQSITEANEKNNPWNSTILLGCGRKQEYLGKIHTGTRTTCKFHIERAQPRFKGSHCDKTVFATTSTFCLSRRKKKNYTQTNFRTLLTSASMTQLMKNVCNMPYRVSMWWCCVLFIPVLDSSSVYSRRMQHFYV